MNAEASRNSYFTFFIGALSLAILLFLLIPLSYGVNLPYTYWINQSIFFILLIGLVIINSKYLAPKFLFRKKYVTYYTILLISCFLIILLLIQTESWLGVSKVMEQSTTGKGIQSKEGSKLLSIAFYIFLVEILVLGFNISWIIVQKWKEGETLRLKIEKENADFELSFLKSQINPHFFFNSLNTVNALTYTDINQSRNALKILGNIMRYVLYKTTNEKVPIQEEITFIKDYLRLMELRSSSKVSIKFLTNIKSHNQAIAPMLFLPLIENCFKHGVSSQSESPVFISLEVNENNLIFITRNKNFVKTSAVLSRQENDGIGLKNTKRRLELIYPDEYSFFVNKNDEFEVMLKIVLK